MKKSLLMALGMIVFGVAPIAQAHARGGPPEVWQGWGLGGLGLGWGRHHTEGPWEHGLDLGEFHLGHLGFGMGWGLGWFDPELLQTKFSDRFDSLQTQYDDGVANVTDFYTTDEYDCIVHKTELLSDHYDWFVGGVEKSITRLDDVISMANDDLTYFNDLLANYQGDDSIPPKRLERIELWIGHITDRITQKVDTLTEKQTTLETNLPTYQTFQTDLETFLTDIVAAGNGGSGSAMAILEVEESLPLGIGTASVLAASSGSLASGEMLALTSAAVPEPSTLVLLLASGIASWLHFGRRNSFGKR